MAAVDKLGLEDFRRRVVAGSFPWYPDLPSALSGLQFVQADPIRSPARAQDLTLRQRVAGYTSGQLEACYPDLEVEEGFLFAYGFATPEVWRDLRWRTRSKLNKLEREVLQAVAELGEAHPRGLDDRFGKKSVRNCWGGKSQQTKQILDDLHDCGLLRVKRREKGVRVYEVPCEADGRDADPRERFRRLAMVTAHVFGPTSKRFLISETRGLGHLLPDRKQREAVVDSLIEEGELSVVEVDGLAYVWIRNEWQSDEIPDRVRILTPFDPLVRNRERFEQLWAWMYRFEAYVPAAKRQRGYYAMPVLWGETVVGWANGKVSAGRLDVQLGYVETRPRAKAFRLLAETEVEAMALFLGLESGAWKIEW